MWLMFTFSNNLSYVVWEYVLLAARDDVISIFPDGEGELHTTRLWDFLGVTSMARRSLTESNIIIGVIHTGVRHESNNFSEQGLGPPPTKWKGICQSSWNFSCHKYMHYDYLSN